jgi:hypothetical protein
MAFLTGESLFCSILEAEYNALVLLIETAIEFPHVVLQLLKSAIDATLSLVYKVIEASIIAIEQTIIDTLNLDGIDLSKTKEGFCDVAFSCVALRDKIFNMLSISDKKREELISDFDEFNDLICKNSLRGLFEGFTNTAILEPLLKLLRDYLKQIDDGFTYIDQKVQDYIEKTLEAEIPLLGRSFRDYMDDLDAFAQCAFATCNFAATSLNFKEDKLGRAGVDYNNGIFTMAYEKYDEVASQKNILTQKITQLIAIIEDNQPRRGVQPDNISR